MEGPATVTVETLRYPFSVDEAMWADELWAATRGALYQRGDGCNELHGCLQRDESWLLGPRDPANLFARPANPYRYGDERRGFAFDGAGLIQTAVPAGDHPTLRFTAAATPQVFSLEPRSATPGTLVTIKGSGLEPTEPMEHKIWYMSEWGCAQVA